MPTPKFDPSDEVAKVDQEFSAIVKQADELSSHSEKRIKELKSELESVQAEKARIWADQIFEAMLLHLCQCLRLGLHWHPCRSGCLGGGLQGGSDLTLFLSASAHVTCTGSYMGCTDEHCTGCA